MTDEYPSVLWVRSRRPSVAHALGGDLKKDSLSPFPFAVQAGRVSLITGVS